MIAVAAKWEKTVKGGTSAQQVVSWIGCLGIGSVACSEIVVAIAHKKTAEAVVTNFRLDFSKMCKAYQWTVLYVHPDCRSLQELRCRRAAAGRT
jgi:hypothetical protein